MLLRVDCEAFFLLMVATVVANSSAELIIEKAGDGTEVCSAFLHASSMGSCVPYQ